MDRTVSLLSLASKDKLCFPAQESQPVVSRLMTRSGLVCQLPVYVSDSSLVSVVVSLTGQRLGSPVDE